jgi:SAM-dependent methyltransferase
MWGSGDYPLMVETFLLPVGERLVDALGIGPGMPVLDVAAGTGNASLPAARRGADVTASDLTPALLEAGRAAAESEGLELDWVEADAEHLPFPDESFDIVMSAIGVMFAPHHQAAADELVRVCRTGGTIGLLSWTPEGMLGALFRTMKPFAPPPPPGVQPPPLWGGEENLRDLLGDRVELRTVERDVLEITAFARPREYGEHFKGYYGPTIAVRANAEREGRAGEFDATAPHPLIVVSNREPYLHKNSELMEGVLKAIIEGMAFALSPTQKPATLKILQKYLRINEKEAEEGYKDMVVGYDRKPYALAAGVNNVVRFMKPRNPAVEKVKAAELIDDRILRKLDQAGFVDEILQRYGVK